MTAVRTAPAPPDTPGRAFTGPGGAVVTGASYRALAVARSLGRAGIPVWVLRSDEHVLAERSRYALHTADWPDGDDAARREALLALLRRHGLEGWTLIPTSDEDAGLMAREHAILSEHARVTVPPWPVLELAYDKRAMHRVAGRVGLPQPRTDFPKNAEEVAELPGPFPLVIKPAFKRARNALTADKAWRADDRRELMRRYAEACRICDPDLLMVQELVGGRDQLSFAALCDEGEVIASVTARRKRQYPPQFGKASTYVETIVDPSVERDGRRVLEAMRFTGLAEVEFKRDPSSGQNRLLDVNPRAWGWQSLCGRAGVDFPLLLWRGANGLSVPRPQASAGVRWVRMSTDLPAVAAEIRRGRLSVRGWLASLRGPIEYAVMATDDPVPGLVDGFVLGRLALSRLRHDA